jgi:hypothetical protein
VAVNFHRNVYCLLGLPFEAACRRLTFEDKGLTCVEYEFPGFGSIEEMSTEKFNQRVNASKILVFEHCLSERVTDDHSNRSFSLAVRAFEGIGDAS